MQIEQHSSPFEDAVLYDRLLGSLDFGVDFFRKQAIDARGRVLEVGCGTGRILLPCLQAGVDIDGLDLAPTMLDRLRQRAATLGFAPSLYEADMSNFVLPRRYRLIFIACNSFNHNLTQEAQISCLRQCKQHLEPDGLLLVETYYPSLEIIGAKQGDRVLELDILDPDTGRPLRVWDTRNFDRVGQIQHSVTDVEFLDAEGRVEKMQRSEFDVRWVYKAEFELLFRAAGFTYWQILGGYDGRLLAKEDDQPMIGKAWNDPAPNS